MEAKKPSHIAWIWRLWRERGLLIALLFFLTLLSSAVAVAYPYLTKVLLDTIQGLLASGAPDASARIRGVALLILATGGAGWVASLFPGVRGAVNVVYDYLIRRKYFGAVLAKDYRFFASFRSGDVVTRLTDDIHDFPRLSWFLCSGIFRAVESISKVGFCLAAMFALDWRLTLISLVPLPIMIAVFAVTQDRIYDTVRKNQEAISDINSQLEMSFSGARIIKAYACEAKYGRFFEDALRRRFGTEMAVARLETVLRMVYMYIDYVMQASVVFVGGWMAVKGSISIGTFYAFYNYLGMLVYPILDIPQLFVSGKRAFVNIDRLEELRAFPSAPRAGTPLPSASVESVEAEGLSFRYEGREEDALSGVGFRIGKGERLAVIGPVGSGKTTLIKLLAGLLRPAAGSLAVNGVRVEDADAPSLAVLVGYVPQEALLFSGTIRDNVAFGAQGDGTSIGDEDFRRAISTAQLSDELAAFAEGEKTMLGQRGVAVSGGQRQRLAIARAVAHAPRLLLLDDITASLDAGNEERLMRALSAWSSDLACVIVSHRLSTLQYADKVLFLSGGRALAFGRHEDLLDASPEYRAFIEEHLSLSA